MYKKDPTNIKNIDNDNLRQVLRSEIGYNEDKRVKKRIDTLLLKSLEFKSENGQKVKVIEIPVLQEENPLYFKMHVRLQSFLKKIDCQAQPNEVYSFKMHLKKVLKWTEYQEIYQPAELKNNA